VIIAKEVTLVRNSRMIRNRLGRKIEKRTAQMDYSDQLGWRKNEKSIAIRHSSCISLFAAIESEDEVNL
jgi:hypothetical protein